MAIYGYARVSTVGQNLTAQLEALKEAGATKIIKDKKSGKDLDRAGITTLLAELKAGDMLIVTKLDRIARNVKEGIELIDLLNDRGITLHILNMGIFDSSPTSKLIRNILLSVAEFEREMILERQKEGIEAAKQKGIYKGRVKKFHDKSLQLNHAVELYKDRANNKKSMQDIADIVGMSRMTLYRELKRLGIKE